MTKKKHNKVSQLITTLSKAEKRYFRLFATRNQSGNLLFIDLFDAYDQLGMVSDEVLEEKIEGVKKSQLPNLRTNLYNQLLNSLRLQYQKNNSDIDIRQKIDYAKVLHDKGLYRQSLEMLSKVKKTALEQNRNILALEILFFEKSIESQNITKSIGNRAQELIQESSEVEERIRSILHFSNLDLELYSYFLQYGFCKSEEDLQHIADSFHPVLEDKKKKTNDFYSKVYRYQCQCWYHYIRQEFREYFEYAKEWVNLFDDHEEMIEVRSTFYLKGIHNVIAAAFILQDTDTFKAYYERLQDYRERISTSITWNEEGIFELYFSMHKLDICFLTGNFSGYEETDALAARLYKNPYNWDEHRLSVFYYKLGCLEFGKSNYRTAIDHFHSVGTFYKNNSNSMVFMFSKILLAFAHFQEGSIQLVDSMVQSLQKDTNKNNDYQPLERELIRLLYRLVKAGIHDRKGVLRESLTAIKKLQNNRFTPIAFLHFYATEWIESQLTNVDAEDIIARNFQAVHAKKSIFTANE